MFHWIRRVAVALALVLGVVALVTPVAAASTNLTAHTLSLYAQQHHAEIVKAVSILFGYLASHATAFLTHENAPPRVKALISLVLSGIAGAVATVIWSNGEPWYLWVEAIGSAFFTSQGAYLIKDIPGIGSSWLQSRGLSIGDPEKANPTDPAVFPGA